MVASEQYGELLGLFADLIDYPAAGLEEKARACEQIMAVASPEAKERFRAFREFAEATPTPRLEEVYSAFFDLNPVCHPYVGHQLFGETYKRSSFLLKLKELYQREGFAFAPNEVPDRLPIVLRFLAHSRDERLREETVREGVIPALERMTKREAADSAAEESAECDGEVRLEGHSHGEVLRGGFVLSMTDGAASRAGQEEHPYQQALTALRLVLEQLEKVREDRPWEGNTGVGEHA